MVQYINDVPSAPKAVGPYSQAAAVGGIVFLSGQIAINPETGKLLEGEVDVQTVQVMKNLKSVLKHLNLDFMNIAKTTIYLTSMADYQTVNKIYEEWMGEARPARAAFAVAGLPLGAKVEIEMVATR